MKLAAIKQGATAMAAHTKLLLHKKSPEIWLAAGIATVVGGAVLACYASRKLDNIFEEHEEERGELDVVYEFGKPEGESEILADGVEATDVTLMTEKQYKRECAKLTLRTGGELVKLYAPAAITMTIGFGMIVNGHRILSQRNAALLAAYTTLDEAFTKYRDRVRERYGEQVEDDIFHGRTREEVTVTTTDENGKKKKEKQEVVTVDTVISPYAKFFDETCREWTRSPDYNHTFLICQQNAANDLLRSRQHDGFHKRGFVFLNEVYKMLGIPETPTGALCGWVTPEDGEEFIGDDYISFGMIDPNDPSKRAFINGYEKSILLDFNCQGKIYDLI